MRIKVTDPENIISSINLIHESPNAVVLHIDLHEKYAEIDCSQGHFHLHLGDAQIEVEEMPFTEDECDYFSETRRYTCYVCWVKTIPLLDVNTLIYKD